MSEMSEADLTAAGVDTRPWEASEDDEEAVLRALYGEPDPDGVYRGEAAS
ncbi:hypothetical protein ACFWYW_55695 [Nonomuraea sp. NPDC059023]